MKIKRGRYGSSQFKEGERKEEEGDEKENV